MPYVNLEHGNVAYNTVARIFDTLMEKQRGSRLLGLFGSQITPVEGASDEIRQFSIEGSGYFDRAPGESFKTNNIVFGKRYLKTKEIYYRVELGSLQLTQSGLDEGQVANELLMKYMAEVDNHILNGFNGVNGIIGASRAATLNADGAEVETTIVLPRSQYIAYDEVRFGYSNTINDPDDTLKYGLTPNKLAVASSRLRHRGANSDAILCIASSIDMPSNQFNPLMNNVLTNVQPAAASGISNPFGGIRIFVESPYVKMGVPSVKGDGTLVNQALVLDSTKVKVGITMGRLYPTEVNLTFETLQTNHDLAITVKGIYDCNRLQEEAIFVIECKA